MARGGNSGKPVRLLSPLELVQLLEVLEIDELVDLNRHTGRTRGDEAYIVAASQWFRQRPCRFAKPTASSTAKRSAIIV